VTDRKTANELDFTDKQVLDALRADGWDIPTTPPPKISMESQRLLVRWDDTKPETPTP